MKKLILLILLLMICNIGLLYAKTYSSRPKKIDVHLKEDEIALIFLPLSGSNSLLIKRKEFYILYVFDYLDEDQLEETLGTFTNQIDYIFVKEDYPLPYSYKRLLDSSVMIQDIQLEKGRIRYHNQTFCMNEVNDCDYIYLTEEIPISKGVKAIFYADTLSEEYLQSLHEEWIDFYKITKDSYTILLWNDEYRVLHLQH